MKIFHAVAKSHSGADEKHEINFHWPKLNLILENEVRLTSKRRFLALIFIMIIMKTEQIPNKMFYHIVSYIMQHVGAFKFLPFATAFKK